MTDSGQIVTDYDGFWTYSDGFVERKNLNKKRFFVEKSFFGFMLFLIISIN